MNPENTALEPTTKSTLLVRSYVMNQNASERALMP